MRTLVHMLCLGMPSPTFRVDFLPAPPQNKTTQSVGDGIPTQSVGTRIRQLRNSHSDLCSLISAL